MDYCDGNQLGSDDPEAKWKDLGIPPAIEPLMGPIDGWGAGLEVKNRGDWKVICQTPRTMRR
jgi:hypothetical protein